eukprot:6210665-Pleurochrysis_carterae.AAC.2
MMNWARIQMKKWIEKKNEPKASVQRRWEHRGIVNKAPKRWKSATGDENNDKDGRTEEYKENEEGEEKIYGIKHWGRVRAIPRIHITG